MRTLLVILVTLGILAAASAPAACMGMMTADRPLRRAATSRISIELENQPVREALLAIAKQADLSIVIGESVSQTRKVTAILKNVPADEAISLVARQAGLTVEPVGEGETLLVEAKSGNALVNIVTGTDRWPFVTVETPWGTGSVSRGCAFAIQPQWDELPMTLVDLKAEDTTVAEAMAALEKQLELWSIIVDEAVSHDIKVNAKVVKMPFREVMRLLLGQAGLTFSVESHLGGGLRQAGTVYVVPPPTIEVSGAADDASSALAKYYSELRRTGIATPGALQEYLAEMLKHGRLNVPGAGERFDLVVPTPSATAPCAKCGAPMQQDWRFCPKCGAERKAE